MRSPPQPSAAGSPVAQQAGRLTDALWFAGPPLLFGLRLWASVCLALYLAFWLKLDNASWAGTSAAIMCQPQLGASLRKGWYRLIGTVVGAVAIVVLTACFPQDRALFLGGLALWGASCALVATLLRNFAAYAAALAGFTAVIIAADTLGATGGAGTDVFMLAVWRASEICLGIVSAGVVLGLTDFGDAPRRLAALFASLCAGIMSAFCAALAKAGRESSDSQPVRREFVRRIIALDPVIDQSLGESSRLRYHSPILRSAVDGLFGALSAWRAMAGHLVRLPRDEARHEAGVILQALREGLRSQPSPDDPGAGFRATQVRWMADPVGPERTYEAVARRLIDLPASTISGRLLADQAAKLLAGIAQALNAIALLVADPERPPARRGGVRLRIADWLPAFVNAGRAFVTISAVVLLWIVTAWPSGGLAVTFAAITVIMFAPRADQAYAMAMQFMVGTLIAAFFAAFVEFAVLPQLPNQTFAGFSFVLFLYLVPVGALVAQPWLTAVFIAMTANFVPMLAPANLMSYDPARFYNQALAIVVGVGVGAFSFRLLPPLSPAYRTRRLLALTLRDLRRLARGGTHRDWDGNWEGHVLARLLAMPDEATPLQRAELMAALSVGGAIIDLRRIARWLGPANDLVATFAAIARGDSAAAIARLARLDAALAVETGPGPQTMLRARAGALILSEALAQHAAYFDAGASR